MKKLTRAEKRYNNWLSKKHLHCMKDGKFVELSKQDEIQAMEPPLSLTNRKNGQRSLEDIEGDKQKPVKAGGTKE